MKTLPQIAKFILRHHHQFSSSSSPGKEIFILLTTLVAMVPLARAQLTASLPPYALADTGTSTTLGPPQVSPKSGLTYQWLVNSKAVAGATNAAYATPTNLNAGFYNYTLAISQNGAVVTNLAVTLITGASLLDNPGLWIVNKNTASFVTPPHIGNDTFYLTDNQGGEASSAFFNTPLSIADFTAAFTYQDVTTGGADGFSFSLENSTAGPTALGGSGGDIGIVGVTPSVNFDFDIYGGNSPNGGNAGGFALNTDGGGPAPYASTTPVQIAGGDPINVFISYHSSAGGAEMTLVDTVTAGVFQTSVFPGDFTSILGASSAYFGFTGATGGAHATQVITNFILLYDTPNISILKAPTNVNASIGQSITFTVGAAGSPPLTYQWRRSGTNIAGATGSSFTITNVQLSDAGNYTVVVGSLNTTATATVSAKLTVSGSVSASLTPSTAAIFSGLSETFVVSASGTPPLTYQWFNGSSPIAGATGPSYTTPANLAPGAYSISVAVSNATSSAQPTAMLTVKTTSFFEEVALQFGPLSFWPLDETSGTVAYDYAGGNNGAYVNEPNVLPGQPGPTLPLLGGQTSAFFSGPSGGGYVDVPRNNLDLLGSLTMFAWIQSAPVLNFETFFGHSDNSYRMDLDTSGYAHFADNPAGDAISTQDVADNNWHLIAGVYDASTGNRTLYVDGAQAASANSAAAPAGSGLDVIIGGDPQYIPSRLFTGYIADAAIYNKALTSSQIQQLYAAAGVAPTTTLPVTQFYGDLNGSVSLTANALGTAPLSLQWYYLDTSDVVHAVPGQTNATLTLNNISSAQNGFQYFLVAMNSYGSSSNAAVLTPADLVVQSGTPSIQSDISPTTLITTIGTPVTFNFGVFGTAPITYQWFKNGAPIPGASNASYTFPAEGVNNTYSVTANNNLGATSSSVATVFSSLVLDDGTGWTINPSGTFPVTTPNITTNAFFLTDGNNSEGVSGWFSARVPINVFEASFTFTVPSGSSPPADGMSFSLQNSGPTARGGVFAISGVSPSANWDFNLYPGNNGGVGVSYASNGIINNPMPPAPIVATTAGPWPINEPIRVTIDYDSRFGVATEKLMDTVTGGMFLTNFVVGDLTKVLGGNDAYVGFTAATGGLNATMIVSDFTFTTVPSLSINGAAAGTSILIWTAPTAPALPNTFTLQSAANLLGPWAALNASPTTQTNGVTTFGVTNMGPAQFYRLVSP